MRRVDHPYSVSTDYQRYYWETQWQDYDEEKMLADVRWEGILPVALRVFARGSRLLEAGCGTGKYCLALSRAGRRVVGVDFARAGLVAARHVEPQLGVLQGSVVEMPFRDHCFDGALSLGVVEHFQSGPEAALRELARVIRPGGTLLLTVPFQNLLLELKELFLPTHDNASVADMVFYQYLYRRDEMAACLGKAGFRVAMVKYIGKQLGLSEAGAHVEGVKNATRALARIIHPWTEPDGLDASSRRSDEGAGWRPASEE
ncbi:MAG: methyltransferase domain-containing protein, partial [Deltaproteobacteria bacterium]|nr:methyltransferase domain-containing protein [Deltaproteobacteria bacterium]